ncbi:tryptophan--tRNA ligase [Blastococcus sp. Marseille-P5729]|uniref:tryptophan--tRNA ligase n=1 Tax=Blastococcus sp. Marseille-P5729 TaxID=2086582 RepID=UPI001F00C8D3|nr:tryptophan--tRNA ligase [Blastococcus sp. Marseille-P5729]
MSSAQRVFSGIQPTADSFHLGNYFGALKHWVSMQEEGSECIYCVVDLHAITIEAQQDPAQLHRRTLVSYAQLLAMGIDPKRSVLFVQSHVPEHSQLSWILQCITGFGEAGRMTQFKDKSGKEGSDHTSVGLFTYPMLMAADILLYNATGVPVGEDQRQHLELTRDLAQRFNARFGKTFVVPEAIIRKETAKFVDLQNPTGKMSKSAQTAGGMINVLDEPKQIAKRIKSAVTDNEGVVRFDRETQPGVANLLSILGAATGRDPESLVADYDGKGYGALKTDVADAVVAEFEPIATRTKELLEDPSELIRAMGDGAQRARSIAAPVMESVSAAVGFVRIG